MITVLWSGISTCGTNRVWGYFRDNTESGMRFGYQHYVFWGHKGGVLRFGKCDNNAVFHKDKFKKMKRYKEFNQADVIESEYGQYRTARKLRVGY